MTSGESSLRSADRWLRGGLLPPFLAVAVPGGPLTAALGRDHRTAGRAPGQVTPLGGGS